jgi:hypothetical protein
MWVDDESLRSLLSSYSLSFLISCQLFPLFVMSPSTWLNRLWPTSQNLRGPEKGHFFQPLSCCPFPSWPRLACPPIPIGSRASPDPDLNSPLVRPRFLLWLTDSCISDCFHACGLLIALMMEVARTSETLVNFSQTTQHYNPEDSHLCSELSLEFVLLNFSSYALLSILILLFLLFNTFYAKNAYKDEKLLLSYDIRSKRNWLNKIGKVYTFEYTDIPKVFVMPHHGR